MFDPSMLCTTGRSAARSVVALAVILAACAGCDEQLLPPVPGPSAAGEDAASEPEVITPPGPAFVEPEGVPRYVPGDDPTPAQEAQWQAKVASGEEFDEMKLLPEVKVASQRLADETVVDKGSLAMPLAGNEALLTLEKGAVLTGAPADDDRRRATGGNNLFGFARKVKSVQQVGDKIVIQTEPAKIEDVATGALHLSAAASRAKLVQTDGADLSEYFFGHPKPSDYQGFQGERFDQLGRPLTVDLSYSDKWGSTSKFDYHYKKEKEAKGVTFFVEAALKAEAKYALEPRFDLYVWIKGFTLRELRVGAGGKLEAGAKADLEITVGLEAGAQSESLQDALDKLGKEPLGHEPDQTVLATMGPYKGPVVATVPTHFTIEFVAACKLEITGTVQVHAEGGVKADAYFGFEYVRDRDPEWKNLSYANWQKWFEANGTVSAGAELKCTVGPRVVRSEA